MSKPKVGSLFTGIGGFDLGFERAGFDVAFQVEIELFCRKVLATRFPNAERFEDVRMVGIHNLRRVDVLCAGVPCQDVSVAGKRAGLAGERTGLFYEFARILQELRPAWFVFENVPGLFSSNGGRDFAEVLRVLMVECGYGVSWRVLNSQFFGVAQRRRRVFIVGCFGKPCPAAILFESESREGNPVAGGEAWTDIANSITSGTGRAGSRGADDGANIVARSITAAHSGMRSDPNGEEFVVAETLNSRHSPNGHGAAGARVEDIPNLVAAPLSAGSHDASHAPGRRREDDFNLVATLNSGGNHGGFRTEPGEHFVFEQNTQCSTPRLPSLRGNETPNYGVAFAENQRGELRVSDIAPQLSTGGGKPGSGYSAVVAPLKASDAKNFADSGRGNDGVGTAILSTPHDADGVRGATRLPVGLDSARYRALGNAVTVSVAEWIARRLALQFLNSQQLSEEFA